MAAARYPLNFFTALIVIVFGFFFATVSSRMVGLIGSSNNPVSGMAIATLLISTFAAEGHRKRRHPGHDRGHCHRRHHLRHCRRHRWRHLPGPEDRLPGGRHPKQQMGEMVGVVVSAVVIGAILYLLSMAWGGYGSDDLPAPQAMLMKMIVEGVMGGNLPWNLVFTGVFIAIVVEILGIPVLPFAIGLYLPIYLSVPMILGGALRWYLEKRKCGSEKEKNDSVQSGVLYSSGLIAAVRVSWASCWPFLAIIPIGLDAAGKELYLSDKINLSGVFSIGSTGGLVCFAGILLTIYFFATKDSKKSN